MRDSLASAIADADADALTTGADDDDAIAIDMEGDALSFFFSKSPHAVTATMASKTANRALISPRYLEISSHLPVTGSISSGPLHHDQSIHKNMILLSKSETDAYVARAPLQKKESMTMTTIRTIWVSMFLMGAAGCAQLPARDVALAQVDGEHHIAVRAEGGRLWWSHRPWSEPHELWKLPGNGAVENLAVRQVATDKDPTFEVSFAQDGKAWHGEIVVDPAAMLDTPVTFLRGNDDSAFASELARSGR